MADPRNFVQGFLQLGATPQDASKEPQEKEKEKAREIPPRPTFEPQKGILRTAQGQDLADFDFQAHSGESIHAILELPILDAAAIDQLQNFSNIAREANVTIIADLSEPKPWE